MALQTASASMAAISPTTFTQQLPTPSPFSIPVASIRGSARPPIQQSELFLRFVALLLSFVSALSLTLPQNKSGQSHTSFNQVPELM